MRTKGVIATVLVIFGLLSSIGVPTLYDIVMSYFTWRSEVNSAIASCNPEKMKEINKILAAHQTHLNAHAANWDGYRIDWAEELEARKVRNFCQQNPSFEVCAGSENVQ